MGGGRAPCRDRGYEPGAGDSLHHAELEKTAACRGLYKAVELRVVRELHEGSLPFGAKFVYDAKLLMALLIPLGKVEHCRAAIEIYRQEYEELRSVLPSPVDGT